MRKNRTHTAVDVAILLLWATALVGYFGPWITRFPASAALSWNAYDLYELVRVLPEIESGALSVHLQGLQMPLLALAALIPVLAYRSPVPVRIGTAILGCCLAALTLPPYPEIMTAWKTAGWCVPFWWGIGVMAWVWIAVWAAPRLSRSLPGDFSRHWLCTGIAWFAVYPAAATLTDLLPALRAVHAAQVSPGWGFWSCVAGLTLAGILTGAEAITMTKEQHPSDYSLARLQEVKAKYEADLLAKANVVAVGIGVPLREGRPQGPAIVVSVTHKVNAGDLAPEDLVPQVLEGVGVWVEEIGPLHAQVHGHSKT